MVKNLPMNAGDNVSIPGSGRPLEKETAAFLSGEIHRKRSLAGRLQSMESKKS